MTLFLPAGLIIIIIAAVVWRAEAADPPTQVGFRWPLLVFGLLFAIVGAAAYCVR